MGDTWATGPRQGAFEEVIDICSPGLTQNTTRPDSSSFTVHVEKLTGENFGDWKFQMSVNFRAKKMLGIVDGSITQEGSDDPDEWEDRDVVCQSMILSALDTKLMRRLRTCRTANQMWRRLCTVYELNAMENVQLVQQKFYKLRMRP